MEQIFEGRPIRRAARRGERSVPMRRAHANEPWPPLDRDEGDAAVLAARLLALSGRMMSRVNAITRNHETDPYVFRLLLLFAESKRSLRVGDVAELLGVSHPTASRAARRAHAAGLIDKFASPVDGRTVALRLTANGRGAVEQCLDALRPDAHEVLGRLDRPRIDAANAFFGRAPYKTTTPARSGWRAGVRAGMWDDGDARFSAGR